MKTARSAFPRTDLGTDAALGPRDHPDVRQQHGATVGGDAHAGLNFDHGMVSNDKQMLRQLGMLLRQAVLALLPIMAGLVLVALAAPMLLGAFCSAASRSNSI